MLKSLPQNFAEDAEIPQRFLRNRISKHFYSKRSIDIRKSIEKKIR